MNHHKLAALTLAGSAAADVVLGVVFSAVQHISVANGLYFAVTTGTTVGYGDITPHGAAPHIVAVLIMLIAIPLFSASFALFTSGLVAIGIKGLKGHLETLARDAETRVKDHVEARLRHHLGPPKDVQQQ